LTIGPKNRMVGFPYPRLMVSNERVDQGAAVIVASAERARALGVPSDRWVFVHSVATAADRVISERPHLGRSAPMRLAGRAALQLAGVGPDDLAHIDLYSCFPSAVEIAAAEVGLGLERPLTVTGGLTFAGGPWNNYVTHAMSAMTGRLRDDPGALGLVSGNGGLLTKHAFAVYSTEPPSGGFRSSDLAAEMAEEPVHPTVASHDGSAIIDSYTVMHDRESRPERALLAVCTPDGARTWAWSTEADLMDALTQSEGCGQKVRVKGNQALGLDGA
jgi:acetyl-CoA C-acetyltransferase